MPFFKANDGVELWYETHGDPSLPTLILLHGFTGSSAVFKRNIPTLSQHYHLITPDLRGHGLSSKPAAGYHVSRLAVDLHNLLSHLSLHPKQSSPFSPTPPVHAIGTSLGAAILWSYSELFTPPPFAKIIFVDQAPLQNLDPPDWTSEFANRGLNTPAALAALQHTLLTNPADAHRGTIHACLAYRAYPRAGDPVEGSDVWVADEAFFLGEAMKGEGRWLGKLMADHTAKDWREGIVQTLGENSESRTEVLVVASTRSGCFPEAGPLSVVGLVNGGGEERAKGVAVEWGGHWCYWEVPERFNGLVLDFLQGRIEGGDLSKYAK